jgi:hypothetical protein
MNQVDEPVCVECGEYLAGFPLKHKQKVCSDCQEALDGAI